MMTPVPAVLASVLLLTPPQDPAETSTRNAIVVEVPDRPVHINAPDRAALEPYLVAHPQDARHLLAGVFLVREYGDPRGADPVADMVCTALTSFDAGATWLRHDFPDPSCLDPWGSSAFPGTMGERILGATAATSGVSTSISRRRSTVAGLMKKCIFK